jgi:ATP-dependent Clp protease protease subunit
MSFLLHSKKRNNEDDNDDNITYISRYKNNIYFYSDVNRQSAYKLNSELLKLESKMNNKDKYKKYKHINLFINSNGGEVYYGLSIINVIKHKVKTPIHSYIDGIAFSCASLISIVCDKRFAFPYSLMLIHQIRCSNLNGLHTHLKDEITNLNLEDNMFRQIYLKYTKLTKKKLSLLLNSELELDVHKCLEYGLIDKILT